MVIFFPEFLEKVSKLPDYRITDSIFDNFYFPIHISKNYSVSCTMIVLLYSISINFFGFFLEKPQNVV